MDKKLIKYRLIKAYPGSEPVGTVVSRRLTSSVYRSSTNKVYPKDVIEKSGEFWYIKPLIFTTKDGVDIYEHDTYYHVCRSNFSLGSSKAYNSSSAPANKYALFSTRELAEQFILENKPTISVKDLEKWLQPDGRIVLNMSYVIQMAQQKLNK